MAMFSATSSSATSLNGNLNHNSTNVNFFSSQPLSVYVSPAWSRTSTIVNMAPKKKVNKIDGGWKKQWFGAGIFYEGSEDIEVDVFKKLEKGKVLSNVEKAGLLTKAEELGLTLSSIEKLGLLSKAEDLGLLSLLENVAGSSPATLASAALPALVAALAVIVLIPDDSAALVAAQYAVAGRPGN